MGRGGACVPARVALQGRIHRSIPAYNACIFVWKRRCADVRAGTQAPPLRFRLGELHVGGWFHLGRLRVSGWCRLDGLCVNGYFVCVGLCGKILRGLVGAVPVCPPVSPHKGASVVKSPRTMRVFLLWKRRCVDVRAGTQAPPLRVSFEVE